MARRSNLRSSLPVAEAATSTPNRNPARPSLGSNSASNTADISTRTSTRSMRSTLPRVVQDSDTDDDTKHGNFEKCLASRPRIGRVLDAVLVPHTRTTRSGRVEVQDTDDSESTASKYSGSSTGVQQDYDTPATSKSMTPIGYTSRSGKGKAPTSFHSEASSSRPRYPPSVQPYADARQKQMQMEADRELARRLQQQEYEDGEPLPGKKRRKTSQIVSDSESTEDDNSKPSIKGKTFKRPRLGPQTRPVKTALQSRAVDMSGSANESEASGSSLSTLSSVPSTPGNESVFSVGDSESAIESDFEERDDEAFLDESATSSNAAASRSKTSNISKLRNIRDKHNAKRRTAIQKRNTRAVMSFRDRMKMRHMDRKQRKRYQLERAHPEIKTMWADLEKIQVIKPIPAEQPASINRKLKPFQLEGLDWMIKQEKTHYRGGLLGDEMGMGKTIQAVSLIMSDFPAKHPTLVVVPPVALMQWQSEIQSYTDGKLKVLVYHNTNAKSKNLTVEDIKRYDVLLISYNSLESLHRKETKGWSRKDDIIKEDSPIHAVKFHRLILDEAHSIKTRTTGVAKACFALQGDYKWCLSGTPVQNRIGEFFSLLRFLEVRPFADYFCEKCSCAQLHWSLSEENHKCKTCNHSGAEHRSVFNEELLNPITGDDVGMREAALDRLHLITARVMLRRLKRDHTSSMELPPKEVVLHTEFFGDAERDLSTSIMTNTTRKFDTYVAQGVMLNNYANIFGLIMQMRQVANHPDLILKKHADGGQNVLVCNICDEPATDAIRSQCRHEFCRDCVKDYVQSCEAADTDCSCPRCHIPLSIDWEQPEIEQDEDVVKKSSIINRIKMENWTSSTKIEMLVYDLYKLRSKKQTLKSIVFSQFTSMLQLIEWRLRRAGFNTVMLDGSMTPAQRQNSIDYFMKNTDVEVFLVSLKAGGVALNLTEASRVFIVDPWWNPAAEWQSADRCHRIGQRRPCVITRLCIEDSVESRMVMLQEKKASMISASINNDKVAMEKLSPEDLQFLFRGT